MFLPFLYVFHTVDCGMLRSIGSCKGGIAFHVVMCTSIKETNAYEELNN